MNDEEGIVQVLQLNGSSNFLHLMSCTIIQDDDTIGTNPIKRHEFGSSDEWIKS